MIVLTFDVNQQMLTRTDSNILASNSRQVHQCVFAFSEEWDGMSKIATFKKHNLTYSVILNNNACNIPNEVLKGSKYDEFDVAVYGTNGERTITTTMVTIPVVKGANSDGMATAITPNMFEQIMGRIAQIEQGEVSPEAVADAIDNYMSLHPVDTFDEEQCEAVVADYVQAHKAELKGKDGNDGNDGNDGVTPVISVNATVSNTTGTPSVEVLKSGTDEAPIFNLAFRGLKGEAGSGGSAELSMQEKFNQNIYIDHAYDASTNANYTVIRVYKQKIDGTQQHPFVRAISPAKPRCSALDLVSTEDWGLVINAGLGRGNPQPIDGVLIQNGDIVYNDKATYHAGSMPLTIDANGDLGYASADATADELLEQGIVAACCGFCPIIVNYEPVSPPTVQNVDHFTQNAQRQIIGQFGNGDYAVVTCEGRTFDNSDGWTIAEAQTICRKLGLKFAYNLDGGGSTQTVIGKKQINAIYENTTGRKLPSFIVFNGTTDMGIARLPKTLVNLRVTKANTTYEVGDTLGTNDIVVRACYSEGTITDVTASATINASAVDMSTAGSYAITVSYTENDKTITKTIDITVTSDEPIVKALDSITASKTATSYVVGDTLNTSDITVTAHYTDNTTADVTASATIDTTNVDMSTAGSYTIGISYTEDGITKTANITVVVAEQEQEQEEVELPEGYTRLNYVAPAGYQYIDTGIIGADIKRCIYEIEVTGEPSNGGHILSTTNMYMPFPKGGNTKVIMANYCGNEAKAAQSAYDWQLNTRYKIEFNEGAVYVNDQLLYTLTKGSNNPQKMYMFTYGGTPTDARYRFSGKLYSFKYYDTSDTLRVNYIPCRNSNNEVGLYNTVTGTFKKSSASALVGA